ncbi:phage tail protein [Streptomyces olivaceoviridis]
MAQRYTAPVKPPPSQAPGMRRVTADIAAKKQKLAQHKPATAESRSAQDAAKAPPDDKEAQGKAANAEKMNAAKPGEFDKAAFIAAVNEAIAAQAPKNLDEADKFADSGKAEKVKGAVDGKVTDGKKASAKDIETTTKAAPDTSKAKEKQVVPLRPDQPPANPGAPSAEDATPRPQPPEVTDFSEGPRKTDQQMADADVTEEQLARSNEPEFTAALGEKRKAEQHSATAPAQARTAEKAQLATAKSGAVAAGAQAMNALTATRNAAGKQVDGGKGEAKSKDEQKRAEVTAKLQKVFDATQKDVEGILEGLDGKVDKQFEEGEKKARDAFTTDQKRRMKAYKDKRYGGFWGPAKWAKDKLMGLPEEANQLFQESRKLYVRMMQGVISSVADTIGTELGRAKARIAKGRADLKKEVDKLPADLKKYGEEAAKDFAGKFDDLESEVDDKSKQLVQTLAQKYTQALNAVDEEIKKLQEANKGLVQKAVDAVAGVIKTIKELKDLLMGILAKAAAAITKIIKDPIGFLGNLVRAVGAGLQQFVSNIGTHLQSGLVSWLLGTAVKAGIEIPSRFDLKGIIQLIASLLGLTWANIRARITRKGVPDQAMNTVEQSVPVAKALAAEGPAGAVNEIQAEVGDLKSTILEELKSYLIPTVIIAGITWILSLLNPASAFVRAVKGIIDIVSFIVNQGAQIVQFVNAVLDAVVAIAGGGSAGVPKMVETALAASVPLLIGFLASLLGIGGLANKIRQVFQKVARPVNRAIDKIAGFIAKAGKKIWRSFKNKFERKGGAGEEKRDSPAETSDKSAAALRQATSLVKPDSTLEGLNRKLPAIKARYGLRSLRLVVDRRETDQTVIHFRAVNSPSQESNPQTIGVGDGEVAAKIRKAMPDHADRYARVVHDYWWNTYVSKTRRGLKDGAPTLWKEADITGTQSEALKKADSPEFQKPLTAYFSNPNRRADTKEFYEWVFTRGASKARKQFLRELGLPVPDKLKGIGLQRLDDPPEMDDGYKKRLGGALAQLGPGSYDVEIFPYGRLSMPNLKPPDHSNFFPMGIAIEEVPGFKRITTYLTRAGKEFFVTETDPQRSMTLRVEGRDLQLKVSGDPRGVTEDSPGIVTNLNLNRSHVIGDLFGGSGYKAAKNLVTTSDFYNQAVMGEVEGKIVDHMKGVADEHGTDVADARLDLRVTVTFGELLSDVLTAMVEHQPWWYQEDATDEEKEEAKQRLQKIMKIMLDPPVRRVLGVKYEWTVKLRTGVQKPGSDAIGADTYLFVKRGSTGDGDS